MSGYVLLGAALFGGWLILSAIGAKPAETAEPPADDDLRDLLDAVADLSVVCTDEPTKQALQLIVMRVLARSQENPSNEQ